MAAALRRHVMDAWFPRCIDPAGGFFPEFDRQWRPSGRPQRMLEHQARQTRVTARFALAFPDDGRWQEYTLHGLRYLRDHLWDHEKGGWFWRVTTSGEALDAGTKHAHSSAYAAQSAALAFEATGDRSALELAQEALSWWDSHGYDREFGGFHSWLTREGAPILTNEEVPSGLPAVDPLGHDIGLKDVNSLGDWIEALLDFSFNVDSARARALLDEMTGIYLKQATTAAGEVHYAFYRNWQPQPGLEWYGYGFEACQRMLYAAAYLPQFPELRQRARAIMRRTVRQAQLAEDGFAYAGPGGLPTRLEGAEMRVKRRVWWTQFDGLRVLALYAANETDDGPVTRRLVRQWEFIKRSLFDERYGGVYGAPLSSGSWKRRLARTPGEEARKAHQWKDSSHEATCLLESSSILRGGARRAERPGTHVS
jgi:mannobiose 2-epimerase